MKNKLVPFDKEIERDYKIISENLGINSFVGVVRHLLRTKAKELEVKD